MKKIFIDGNYIIVTDANDVELFSAPKSEVKIKNSNGSYMLYHETVDQSFSFVDIIPAEVTDALDVALVPDTITWLRANTGFNPASGGSGAGLGYTSLIMKVSQSGTSNPTFVVISNNTGLTPSFTRTNVGRYQWETGASNFPATKTAITTCQNNPNNVVAVFHDGTNVYIDVKNFSSTFVDSVLSGFVIEIKLFA